MDKLALVEWSWLLRRAIYFLVVFGAFALLKRFGVEQEESKHDDPDSRLKVAARAYGIKPWLAKLILLSPVVLALVVLWVLVFPPTPYIYSVTVESIILGDTHEVRELHPVEMLDFVFEFPAGILGLVLAWHAKKRGDGLFVAGFYALFSIGMLWLAGEEVAWGQWLVGPDVLPTPSGLQETNSEYQITLHNIGAREGEAGWVGLIRRGFGLGGLLGVFLGVWGYSRQRFRKVAAPVILLPWFLIIIIFASPLLDSIAPSTEQWRGPLAEQWRWSLDEVTELMIGMTGFLFVWLNARMLSSMKEAASPADKLKVTPVDNPPDQR